MPNVPTTTPGPDDTEHTLEDVTETFSDYKRTCR